MVPGPWHANGMAIELEEWVALVLWPTLRRMLIETGGWGKPQQVLNASRVRDQAPRCGQVFGIGAAKRLALEYLAWGKALAHDQTPSLSTRVSKAVHCVLWCAQSKVNGNFNDV